MIIHADTSRKANLLSPVAILLLAATLVLAACNGSPPAADTPQPSSEVVATDIAGDVAAAEPTQEITLAEMNQFWADDDPYLGPEDAPVVIVEFSDYVCPYCGYFYINTLPLILEAYPNDVRFVHRDFPILAEESASASLAAACALEQGLFWELHDVLFSTHAGFDPDEPHERDGAFFESLVAKFSEEEITGYAEEAGLDMDAYQACRDASTGRDEIVFDLQVGSQLGIESVPFYIVNGYVYSGSMPFETWQEIITTALAQAGS